MTEIYYDKDADLSLLKGKTIGIIGFGVDQVLAWIGRRVVWWEGRQGRWRAPK